jgi:hypothetical protein
MNLFVIIKFSGMKKWMSKSIYLVIPAIVLMVGLISIKGDRFQEVDKSDLIRRTYGVFAVEIPDSLEFAGENVPLMNFDTRESLDRELLVNTYFHSQTLLYIKKAPRYFPVIVPILKAHNIPEDFKYMPLVESGLSNAISPANAVGYWQLLRGTAIENGLEVNSEVDERYHLEKSTVAACKYLLKSYEKYQNWTMVAASYNNGRRGVDRQIERQKEKNYYDLLLNEETSRYMFRLLALKMILEEPEKYGFHFDKKDLYEPLESYEVVVDSSVTSFADFAKSYHTNYKILKFLNPWLRENYLTNRERKPYRIRIPEPDARTQEFEKELKTFE